jgi:hypothetical protein
MFFSHVSSVMWRSTHAFQLSGSNAFAMHSQCVDNASVMRRLARESHRDAEAHAAAES